MISRQNVLTMALAVCVAGYVAMTVDYFAHRGLGLSAEHIRNAAMGSAMVVAWLMAIAHYGIKPRRAKPDTDSQNEHRSDRLDGQ